MRLGGPLKKEILSIQGHPVNSWLVMFAVLCFSSLFSSPCFCSRAQGGGRGDGVWERVESCFLPLCDIQTLRHVLSQLLSC